MTLKQVTLITTVGIAAAFTLFLINFPWGQLGQNPRMTLSVMGSTLMYSSLLFFLINLYRRG